MLKKLFVNEKGELSWSKVGAVICGIAASIIQIQAMNLSIHFPIQVIDCAKIIMTLSASAIVIGLRDALKK